MDNSSNSFFLLYIQHSPPRSLISFPALFNTLRLGAANGPLRRMPRLSDLRTAGAPRYEDDAQTSLSIGGSSGTEPTKSEVSSLVVIVRVSHSQQPRGRCSFSNVEVKNCVSR